MAEKKLGQILIARKMLTENQLVQALQEQMRLNATSKRQFKLGEILLFAKWIQMEVLQQMLLEQKPRSRTDIEALRQQKNQPQQRQLESVQVLSSNSRRLTTPKF